MIINFTQNLSLFSVRISAMSSAKNENGIPVDEDINARTKKIIQKYD